LTIFGVARHFPRISAVHQCIIQRLKLAQQLHASAHDFLDWYPFGQMNKSTFVVAKDARSIFGGSVWCCLSRISAL
jgi:hypothetical protein